MTGEISHFQRRLLKFGSRFTRNFPFVSIWILKNLAFILPPWRDLLFLFIAIIYQRRHDWDMAKKYLLMSVDYLRPQYKWQFVTFRTFLFTLEHKEDEEFIIQMFKFPWLDKVYSSEILFMQICHIAYKHQFVIRHFCYGHRFDRYFHFIKIVELHDVFPDRIRLKEAGTYSFKDPSVFEGSEPLLERTVETPAWTISVCKDITVSGAFQLIKDNHFLVSEPDARPALHLVAGLWRHYSLSPISPDHCSIKYIPGLRTSKVAEAILLSGRATENYFHWLIEYVPKLFTVSLAQLPEHLPVIVKDGLHPQFYQALAVYSDRPVLKMNPEIENFFVQKLYVPHNTTHHPDIYDFEYWRGSALSLPHLDFLRHGAFKKLGIKDGELGTRKIFISRPKNSIRGITNHDEISQKFIDRGFELIYPESLSFEDQVRLFASASFIAGSTGAAYSNLIFCQPGCRVVGLVNDVNKNYSMQSNLAHYAGASFTFISGEAPPVDETIYGWATEKIHSDFSIDANKIDRFFRMLDNNAIEL